MTAGPTGRSRLVKIVAMEEGFPFYGSFNLKLHGSVKESDKKLLHEEKLAWIYPELESQLGAGLGDEIKLGESTFRVSDFVTKDNGLQFQSAELAPKVFINQDLSEGNQLTARRQHRLPESSFQASSRKRPGKDRREVDQAIDSPEVRVYAHQKAGERAGRLLQYLSDFLSLVSLVAFSSHFGERLSFSFFPDQEDP